MNKFKNKFKAGDRVRLLPPGTWKGYPPVGAKGAVLDNSRIPFVQWENWKGGAERVVNGITYPHVWAVWESQLELASPQANPDRAAIHAALDAFLDGLESKP